MLNKQQTYLKFISIFAIFTLLLGCDNTDPLTVFPTMQYHDMNNDSIYDYVITFEGISTMDVPASAVQFYRDLEPLESNLILKNPDSGYFFLQTGDTLTYEIPTTLAWDESCNVRIFSRYFSENTEADAWTLLPGIKDEYILGLKFYAGEEAALGWIKLGLNPETGEILITDGNFSFDDPLVIQLRETQLEK
mgnify:FL=1